jgi:hypothetical protein
MVDGRQLKKAIDKFMPLLENRVLGSSETHRLVLRCNKPRIKMGKIIRIV